MRYGVGGEGGGGVVGSCAIRESGLGRVQRLHIARSPAAARTFSIGAACSLRVLVRLPVARSPRGAAYAASSLGGLRLLCSVVTASSIPCRSATSATATPAPVEKGATNAKTSAKALLPARGSAGMAESTESALAPCLPLTREGSPETPQAQARAHGIV